MYAVDMGQSIPGSENWWIVACFQGHGWLRMVAARSETHGREVQVG